MTSGRVTPGEPLNIRATDYNAMLAAAEAHAAGKNAPLSTISGQVTFSCINTSENTIGLFQPVEIVSPVIDPSDNEDYFDQQITFNVRRISSDGFEGQTGISQNIIGASSSGPVMILGVTQATVDVIDESHTHAIPNSEGGLTSSSGGSIAIVWKPGGIGVFRVIVSLVADSGSRSHWARITEAVEDGPNRWKYKYEVVRFNEGEWGPVDPPQTDEDLGLAINTLEASNGESGILGNGVDTSNLPAGFSLVPIGEGAIVQITGPLTDGEDKVWTFTVANLVDGSCEG